LDGNPFSVQSDIRSQFIGKTVLRLYHRLVLIQRELPSRAYMRMINLQSIKMLP
ncbi:hypothetical protein MKX01_041932, partial [Papaver californicum]